MRKITHHYIRGYSSESNRKKAIAMLKKRGWNELRCFKHEESDFALDIGWHNSEQSISFVDEYGYGPKEYYQ